MEKLLLLLNFREHVGDAAAAVLKKGGRAVWTDSHRYDGPGRLVGAWPGSRTEREEERGKERERHG